MRSTLAILLALLAVASVAAQAERGYGYPAARPDARVVYEQGRPVLVWKVSEDAEYWRVLGAGGAPLFVSSAYLHPGYDERTPLPADWRPGDALSICVQWDDGAGVITEQCFDYTGARLFRVELPLVHRSS